MRINTTDPIIFIEKKGKIPLFKSQTNSNTFTNIYATSRDIVWSGFTGGIIKKSEIKNILINPKTNEKKNAILRNTISLSYNT
jgi:hypothetical protein